MKPETKTLLKFIAIPLAVGGLSALLSGGGMETFERVVKPPLSPPGWLFPVVWTILYILMGISYGILKSNSLVDSETNFIYYLQLFVNVLWSIFFFVFALFCCSALYSGVSVYGVLESNDFFRFSTNLSNSFR